MKSIPKMQMPEKLTVSFLIIAAAGVALQIISGAKYPPVPPVFFILLIPALLIFYIRKRWPSIIVILVGLFLTAGLFSSKAYLRLYNPHSWGDTAGLWIQTIAQIIALVTSVYIITGVRSKEKPSH